MNRRYDEELKTLLSSDSPIDFYLWVSILNFFDNHKDELNLKELKKLVDKCEECRLYLNKDNTDPIEKSDIRPNVYEYLAEKIKDNKNKETWKQEYQEQRLLTAL